MADQWGQGMDARRGRWPEHAAEMREMDELIVVNSSAGLPFGAVRSLRWPLLGELLSLLRDKDVLYDNGTTLRRYGLVARFDRAALTGTGLRGSLVHIPDSPFTVPRAFEGSTVWPDRATRARAVLQAL